MHKSIILFISLLMILLPLVNTLNISNANAIADLDNKEVRKQVSVNSLKCNNINVNVNGLELGVFPPFLANSGLAAEGVEGNTDTSSFADNNGDSSASEFNDFKFICINNNNNTVIGAEEEPIPPTPPEPTTATLTVKKQVFGCNTFIIPSVMNCVDLRNNSTAWLNCNNISSFNNPIFCQSLPENIFDIEVNASNTQQISQFKGSEDGTTIPNLEPGTYIVNEIKSSTSITDQLGENSDIEEACINAGFTDGGRLDNSTSNTSYSICFEYKDEQGNDCSTITLAAGESRTCTVKNYIFSAVDE